MWASLSWICSILLPFLFPRSLRLQRFHFQQLFWPLNLTDLCWYSVLHLAENNNILFKLNLRNFTLPSPSFPPFNMSLWSLMVIFKVNSRPSVWIMNECSLHVMKLRDIKRYRVSATMFSQVMGRDCPKQWAYLIHHLSLYTSYFLRALDQLGTSQKVLDFSSGMRFEIIWNTQIWKSETQNKRLQQFIGPVGQLIRQQK